GLCNPGPRRPRVRAVNDSRTGQDAIIVGGISLHLHQRLRSTNGAAPEVGILWARVIEGADQRLRCHGSFVDSSMVVIDEPFRMSAAKGIVLRPALVPRVCC